MSAAAAHPLPNRDRFSIPEERGEKRIPTVRTAVSLAGLTKDGSGGPLQAINLLKGSRINMKVARHPGRKKSPC